MSRLSKPLATAAAVALAVPVWAGPASAETVTETAAIGAYYLFSNPGVIGNDPNNPLGGQKAPDNAKGADGVAQDDLAVAVNVPGQVDKFSALQWSLLDLVPEATVASAKVTIPFSEKPESNRNDRLPTLVVACAAGPEGFGDADGEPHQDAPSRDECLDPATAVVGKPAEGGKAVEFDITPIAQKWTQLNTGLVLYPSEEGRGRPFQNVFADKSQARLAISFTAPEAEVFDDPELSATDDSFDTTGSTDSFDSGSFDSGSSDFGSGSAGLDSSSGTAFDAGSLDAPVAAADGEAPSVAGDAPVVAQNRLSRAASSSTNPMALDVATWLAIIGGGVLLAVVSLALGAPAAVPGAARQAVRPGGVASALARRRATAGPLGPRPI